MKQTKQELIDLLALSEAKLKKAEAEIFQLKASLTFETTTADSMIKYHKGVIDELKLDILRLKVEAIDYKHKQIKWYQRIFKKL